MKVIIVEPSRLQQALIRTHFPPLDWEVQTTGSGTELVEQMLVAQLPDLICVAEKSKDLTGHEILVAVRDRGIDIPVVLFSGIHGTPEIPGNVHFTQIIPRSNPDAIKPYLETFSSHCGMNPNRPPKVLYVEDDMVSAKILLHWAKEFKWDVTHFSTADQAWEEFPKVQWDLILTDQQLEGTLQGLDLVREIRKIKDSRLPILVLSAISNGAEKVAILKSGANDFVSKPVTKEELEARVSTLLTMKCLFDVLERQKLSILEMAMKDQLTGLFNRHSMVEIAPKYLHQAARNKSPLSMIILDVDFFKKVNDTYGHQAGDEVLSSIGSFILGNVRKADYAARLGGEEFLILLPDTDRSGALVKAEMIRKGIEALCPGGRRVTASFGVSSMNGRFGMTFEELFSKADKAVYEAKEQGRNCVVYLS